LIELLGKVCLNELVFGFIAAKELGAGVGVQGVGHRSGSRSLAMSLCGAYPGDQATSETAATEELGCEILAADSRVNKESDGAVVGRDVGNVMCSLYSVFAGRLRVCWMQDVYVTQPDSRAHQPRHSFLSG
jgi:hypothetical protein